jgi:peptidoglycan/xylan/chitin deacetylase (PgdA/CDA1 family)
MLPFWDQIKLEADIRDLFTKKEEYSPKQLDQHGRFRQAFSRYQNPLEPSISKYLFENGFRVKYPNNHKFAVCLTHDVDDIFPPTKHILVSSLYLMKSLDFNQIGQQVLWKFSEKWPSPYLNFRKIMEIESKYNAKSTFYFMATEQDPNRFRYKIEELEDEVKDIVNSGWDIGLHVGYYSFNNLEDIIAEKERLEKVLGKEVIGCRNHYLLFKVPDTWQILARAGFKYDTTFGYTDTIGFRNGMCHPFRPVNLNNNHQINIMEVPLNIMDATLTNGLCLNYNKVLNQIKQLVDSVEACNGVLTVLWHNDVFSCPFKEKLAQIYDAFLNYCYEKDAWLASSDEIYQFFCNN